MDFKQNYFEIFQLPVAFDVDLTTLGDRYRKAQGSVHPDKFAGASERDKRLSVQWATRINEAYGTLKSPLSRAVYLLTLSGVDMSAKANAPVDPGFLMEQMELREDLDAIEEGDDALERLDVFKRRVDEILAGLEQEFASTWQNDLDAAEQSVLKMQFITKLRDAAEHLEEKLLDY
ncbi:MAG: Fe-S protein assembly co-chaperone HscB [Pseudomonadales bacterium]|nr:Fe-S protein assembly co-chaperone HscB [Pseudomonadales bacterium]